MEFRGQGVWDQGEREFGIQEVWGQADWESKMES